MWWDVAPPKSPLHAVNFCRLLQQCVELTTASSYTEMEQSMVSTDKSLHISFICIFLPFDLLLSFLSVTQTQSLALFGRPKIDGELKICTPDKKSKQDRWLVCTISERVCVWMCISDGQDHFVQSTFFVSTFNGVVQDLHSVCNYWNSGVVQYPHSLWFFGTYTFFCDCQPSGVFL